MRGKLKNCSFRRTAWRITPADAGKTFMMPSFCASTEDHPRGCGENKFTIAASLAALGSPPRMRGKLVIVYASIVYVRITPADAGKTLSNLS